MSEQTTLTDLTDVETPAANEEPPASPPDDDQSPTRSTLIDSPANPALDAWVAERTAHEEPYGYCHLYLVSQSDLSGITHELRYETQIDLGAVGTPCVTTSMRGFGGVSREAVRDWLIDWLLTELETPYHERLRPIPLEHFRVFATDAACEYLAEHEIDIDTVDEQLHSLPEHQPSDEYLTTHRTLTALTEWLDDDDGLHAYERRIEATIRAQLDFTTRYGHQVPDPVPAYHDYSLTELKAFLTTVREQIDQTEQRCDNLRRTLKTIGTQWCDRIHATHFE